MNTRQRGARLGPWVGGVVGAFALALVAPATGVAQLTNGPQNDLIALGQGGGQTPVKAPEVRRAEPLLVATPRAKCAPGTKTEPGIQGRVPAGSATDGLACNVTQVAHQGTTGGFKVYRYVDVQGHECAFYDTALLFPLNALQLSGESLGIAVLDMTDPAHPVQTDTLTEQPMLSPHESFNVNAKRGLLAAVLGNPATYPGLVSIYDAHADCRHPVLQSTAQVARFGHESGFSPDGKTFYATGTALQAITAIDVTDPKAPHPIWQGNVLSHGLSISDDGNRAYVADPTAGDMVTLDTSQVQARKPDPQVREISRLTWQSASIPQNTIPFTEDGHPYILEFDEYTAGLHGDNDAVGAGRIIDNANEAAPKVAANLRLQVNQAADHAAASGDPGATSPVQGYAGHYCNLPSRVDPKVVACSFIASGLRVFDISDVTAPKEIAYFVAPTANRVENGENASDYAMSQPVIVPERHEVWYTDGASGFYVLRIPSAAWPKAGAPAAGRLVCSGRRRFAVTQRVRRNLAPVRRASATLDGRAVKLTRRGRVIRLTADLRRFRRTVARLVIRVTLRDGRKVTYRRTYHPCVRRAQA